MKKVEIRLPSSCSVCPIHASYGHEDYVPFEVVTNSVDKPVSTAIVGEAPGNDEVKQGRPFIGPAGALLRKTLERAGIENYILLNAVACRPRKVTDSRITFRAPTEQELNVCSVNAKAAIKLSRNLKKVFLAGRTAVLAFAELFPEDIRSLSLSVIMSRYPNITANGITYYPVYHPSYILRQGGNIDTYVPLFTRAFQTTNVNEITSTLQYRDNLVSWLQKHVDDPKWKNIALDYETTTAAAIDGRKLVGIGLSNGQESVYFEMRRYTQGHLAPLDLLQSEKSAWLKFLKTRERVVVYNTSFESNVTYQLTGEWIDFDDAYTLAKILQIRDKFRGGGLKYVAGAVLGVPVWSDEVSDYIKKIKILLSYLEDPFIATHAKTIIEKGPAGLVADIGDALVPLAATESETIEVANLKGTTATKVKKLFKAINFLRENFLNSTDVLEYLEHGKQHGLENELLHWYSIPGEVLFRYNVLDTHYTYHIFEQLFPKAKEWYPNYIKQEWLSSHMESYMLRWDISEASRLITIYVKEALKHLSEVFALPQFQQAYRDYYAKNATIRDLERSVGPELNWPKLSKLNNKYRDRIRKMTVAELDLDTSVEGELQVFETDTSAQVEQLAILSAIKSSLKKAITLYADKKLEELKQTVKDIKTLPGDADSIKRLKAIFNPDSSHVSTRTIFFTAFASNPWLETAAIANCLNQELYQGEPRLIVGPVENDQRFEEIKTAIAKDGRGKKKRINWCLNVKDRLLSGINNEFFVGWYNIFKEQFGLDVDNPETWNKLPEDLLASWKILYHTRVFKKIMKAVNGYLIAGNQDSLGAEIHDPTKPVIAYGKYQSGRGLSMIPSKFHANTAETKRWQSPIHTIPRGSDIRKVYVPRDDRYLFVHFDYSQMEVRALAGMAQDPILLEAYEKGIDVHRLTASRIFNKPAEEITGEERSFAKAATFSVLYGKGLESFARDFLHGNVTKAKEIIGGFFKAYQRVDAWVKEQHQTAKETGKVKTLFGDPIDVSISRDGWDRRAQNYPIQSSASSLAALSGWSLYQLVRKARLGAIVVGFTHDAFDFEVPATNLFTFIDLARRVATSIPRKFGIPAAIDLEVGPNMGDMFEFNEVDHLVYEIHGPESGLGDLIKRLSTGWRVDYEILERSYISRKSRELFETKTAYSISIGQELPAVKAKVSLTPLEK